MEALPEIQSTEEDLNISKQASELFCQMDIKNIQKQSRDKIQGTVSKKIPTVFNHSLDQKKSKAKTQQPPDDPEQKIDAPKKKSAHKKTRPTPPIPHTHFPSNKLWSNNPKITQLIKSALSNPTIHLPTFPTPHSTLLQSVLHSTYNPTAYRHHLHQQKYNLDPPLLQHQKLFTRQLRQIQNYNTHLLLIDYNRKMKYQIYDTKQAIHHLRTKKIGKMYQQLKSIRGKRQRVCNQNKQIIFDVKALKKRLRAVMKEGEELEDRLVRGGKLIKRRGYRDVLNFPRNDHVSIKPLNTIIFENKLILVKILQTIQKLNAQKKTLDEKTQKVWKQIQQIKIYLSDLSAPTQPPLKPNPTNHPPHNNIIQTVIQLNKTISSKHSRLSNKLILLQNFIQQLPQTLQLYFQQLPIPVNPPNLENPTLHTTLQKTIKLQKKMAIKSYCLETQTDPEPCPRPPPSPMKLPEIPKKRPPS